MPAGEGEGVKAVAAVKAVRIRRRVYTSGGGCAGDGGGAGRGVA